VTSHGWRRRGLLPVLRTVLAMGLRQPSAHARPGLSRTVVLGRRSRVQAGPENRPGHRPPAAGAGCQSLGPVGPLGCPAPVSALREHPGNDMEWPAYLASFAPSAIARAARSPRFPSGSHFPRPDRRRRGCRHLAARYKQENCDGLLLSAVTYQGVRLPIRGLMRAIGQSQRPRFAVVDGAQALNHVPLAQTASAATCS